MQGSIRRGLPLLVLACLGGCGGQLSAEEHLARAETFASNGQYAEAVIELRNTLQLNPNLPAARRLMGEVQLAQGDDQRALREFERAIDLGVRDARTEVALNRAKLRVGRVNEVLGDLAERTDLNPALTAVLGNAQLATGDLPGAQQSFERARSEAAGLSGLAAVAAARGDPVTARRYLEEAIRLDPNDAETWLRLGNLEMAERRHGEAEAAFRRAVALPPGELMGHFGLARVEIERNDHAAAAEALNAVLARAPRFAFAHYLRGVVRLQLGELEGAEAATRETQRLAPEFVQADYLLATVLYQQGRRDEAEAALERFLQREPRDPGGLKLLATLLIERDEHEGAATLLEDVVDSSDDPQLVAIYGTTQLRLGRSAEASAAFARAVELAPDISQFRNQLALSLISAGDTTGAEATLTSAVEVGGAQFESEYLLAMLHLQQQDWQAAAAIIERLGSINPGSPIPDQLRGMARQLQGAPDGGAAEFERALSKDPVYLPAVQALAALAEAAGDTTRVRRLLDDLSASASNNAAALTLLGDFALAEKQPAAAADYYQRALTVEPGALRPSLALARLLVAQRRGSEALELVQAALVRAPNQSDLLLLQAELALENAQGGTALAALGQLQNRAARELDNTLLQYAVGNLQLRLGQTGPARVSLDRALAAQSGIALPARLALARLELVERNPAGARAQLNTLETAGASGPELDLLRADILAQEGRPAEAQTLYQALMAAGVREGFLRRAGQQLVARDVVAAISTLETWLEREPDDDSVRMMLADALMQVEPARAIPHYERMQARGHPIVLNNLAWLYMEAGDERAVLVARRALAAAPDNADVLHTVGWVLHQSGNREEALPLLRGSVELNAENAFTLYHLAVALEASGDRPGARQRLEQALALGEFPEAQAAREKLATIIR